MSRISSSLFITSFTAFKDPFRHPLFFLVSYKDLTSSTSYETITYTLRTLSKDFSFIAGSIAIDSGT